MANGNATADPGSSDAHAEAKASELYLEPAYEHDLNSGLSHIFLSNAKT